MRKLPTAPKPRSLPKKHRPAAKTSTGRAPRENILDHEYSPKTGQLTVTFHGGRKYRYAGVSKGMAAKFGDAASKGKFLHDHIIGSHEFDKLED